ncbi:Rne/Rng family ribonuclease, partial [Desulfovibrio sp. OttesenSCG-928-A18]|nr:Rne/Rng family ribonuclease [Desulfovibrio sp. OttesenSCG-928-A18]
MAKAGKELAVKDGQAAPVPGGPDSGTEDGLSAPAQAKTPSGAASKEEKDEEQKRSASGSRQARAGAKAPLAREADSGKTAEPGDALSTAELSEPADFPLLFNDVAPEDAFAAMDASPVAAGGDAADDSAEAAEQGEAGQGAEKRRRGRTRRGGRGRKKSSAQAANGGAQDALDPAAESGAAPAPVHDDELDEDDFVDQVSDLASDPDDGQPGGDGGREAGAQPQPGKGVRRKMFVSVLPGEQVEVVITEEGQVQEYYVEMLHQAKTKGNIYKGLINNVDPNLQAAFVSYGAVKNGFLQIDEVHPEYYVAPHEAGKGRKYPPIQKVLRAGQEVLVQVVKEPAGTKGAFLTTYLSLPGRFLVLTPGREQIGVSRKVDNEAERARLRELLEGLNPGPGLGVIVRTVSMGASKTSLQRDMQFLKRTWKEVRTRGTTEKGPCIIYQEQELTARAVRDYLTEAVGEIWVDDEETAQAVTEVAEALFPRKQNLVRVHKDMTLTLFERFNLQRQLDQIESREVALPSGGRLVVDPTEALTAIDINSGRSGGKTNFEDMAFRTNLEAAKMIPLQLRLRDIGGQVVVDFIEMREKSHWREVEKTLRTGMKVDRARYDVGKVGPFGMLEIVRQRLGSSAISISTEPCPCCNGTGVRRNMEWRSQHALRDILRALRNAQAQEQTVVFYPVEQALALHLLNNKRQRLLEMEKAHNVRLEIQIKAHE